MEQITSRSNAQIAFIRKLSSDKKARRREGLMVCEGPKLLAEALAAGMEITLAVVSRPCCLPEGVRVLAVPSQLLSWLSPTETPQGPLFLCKIPSVSTQWSGKRYLVVDGIQDPGNLGTICRTADAFGVDGMILLGDCADPYQPKAIRATMGAVFRLPIWETNLEELKAWLVKEKLPLYGTALREDTEDIRQISLSRAAVVIGSEGKGISESVLNACHKTIKIPMTARCESLNAAIAAGVVLWEMFREER